MVDVTDATFEAEVIKRSETTPVVVDLWAPWCGPCKTLGPIIERVIDDTGGKVVLAKINVDDNPQASAAFRVQGIPAVYALKAGQVVDGFTGAQPEAKVKEFVDSLLGDDSAQEIDQLLAVGDEPSLRRVLELDATNKQAAVALTQYLMAEQRNPEALAILEPFADDPTMAPLLEAVREAALSSEAKAEIETQLADLLPKVKVDETARAEFVSLLDELIVGDPTAAASWRQKLSTELF